ncbi:exodeoxyribonuclease VII large subunit [Pedobacter sp. MC2016-15]|uniref:exodeoxyribonuclease VII large subunit n=1 Tax=Pedobacter sp. MC2016-15 TaxID=2994473 RepID=UPI002247F583|nr:exodeoxyribonuclease VII large subunit [Pedobacter sp. MC2016-15]MCX2477846.1 exodeoxyribonuclease VII large subunit [Pedobacter sp. MC2016-15]
MAALPSIRLSELTAQIHDTINGVFGARTFWVIADVTNHTYKPQSNFHYFELVEKDKASAKILAKMGGRAWGNAAVNISNFEKATGQQFKNDINVLVQVAVQYNPAFGLQLNLLDIDTNFTLGQFEQQRKETLDRLLRDNASFIRLENGIFRTRNSDLQLNRVLQRIAVISSDTSAGYHDFRHTLDHNTFGYQFEIDDYFALVQGEGNAKQVLAQLIAVFDSGKPYDALVIIRGGGSQMDFLIFDNYELNRAIAKFPIPIITGIGHQKNETIADLMAHTSTKTPTKVAEMLIAHNRSFEDALISLQQQMVIRTFQMMNHHKEQLNRLNQVTINSSRNLLHEKHRDILNLSGMIVTNPRIIISNKRKDLDNLVANLRSFNRMYFINQARYIGHFESVVRLMSPQNILNKGFAIVKVGGVIVGDGTHIEPETEMTVTLATAEINTKVLSKTSRNGKEFEL